MGQNYVSLLNGSSLSILGSLKEVSYGLCFTLSVIQNHDIFWVVSYLDLMFSLIFFGRVETYAFFDKYLLISSFL